jgi:hypothetical protein
LNKECRRTKWRKAVDKLILAVVKQAWNDLQDLDAGKKPARPKACYERESFEMCFELFLPLLGVESYTANKMKSRLYPTLDRIFSHGK